MNFRSRTSHLFVSLSLLFLGCPDRDGTPDGGSGAVDAGHDAGVREVTQVVITPQSVVLAADGELSVLGAVAYDAAGAIVPGTTFTWTVENEAVAQVGSDGRVTAVAIGTTIVHATAGSVNASVPVEVVLQRNAQCAPPGAPAIPGERKGAATFSIEVIAPEHPPYQLNEAAAIDLDADGDNDVVVGTWRFPWEEGYTGSFRAFRNDAGTLAEATAEVFGANPPVADHPLTTITFDANGDGRDDVYFPQQGLDAAPFPGAGNLLFLQTATGALEEVGAQRLSPYGSTMTHYAAAADVDCDGDVDLYDANIGDDDETYLLVNDGAANFVAGTGLPHDVATTPKRNTSADFCDVDRDGDQDLVLGGWRRRDEVLINDGFGQFRFGRADALPLAPFPDAEKVTTHLYCRDFDHDGWPDVISSVADGYYGGQITIARNQRDGTFADANTGLQQSVREWYAKVLVGDVNADGWLDLVASQPSNFSGPIPPSEVLFLNSGDLTFTEQALPDVIEYGRLFPFELTGDGKTDLLVLDLGKGMVRMLRNTTP